MAEEEIARYEKGRIILHDVMTHFADPGITKIVVTDLSKLNNPDDFANLLEQARELIKSLVSERESQT